MLKRLSDYLLLIGISNAIIMSLLIVDSIHQNRTTGRLSIEDIPSIISSLSIDSVPILVGMWRELRKTSLSYIDTIIKNRFLAIILVVVFSLKLMIIMVAIIASFVLRTLLSTSW